MKNKVYILTRKHIRIYSLKFEKLSEAPLENGKRFRRENDMIPVVASNFISQYVPEKKGMTTIFEDQEAQIVDKNILSYFAIKGNKLYLYSLEKVKKAQQQKQLEAQPESPPPSTEKPVEKTEEKTS